MSRRLRSQSLQLFTGLAIWKCVPMIVYLEKDSKGLGFSIVDYQVRDLPRFMRKIKEGVNFFFIEWK